MSVKNSDNYVWTNTSNLSCSKVWFYPDDFIAIYSM
jgi:hypothetical protein